jgi:glycosyltransferase involved in cell wall biosynthesis
VRRLVEHLPARYASTVLATRPVPELLASAASEARAPVVPVAPVRGKRDVLRLAAAALALRRTRPELVHVNLAMATNNRHVLGALAVLRLPAVATLHSVVPVEDRRQRAILRTLYARLGGAIAVSDGTRRQLCDDLGLSGAAVALVPNGVERREPVALADPRPVRIGSVGRLARDKGFDLLVEAVRGAVGDGAAVEAVVAGEGPELERLRAASEGLPVRFLGWVEDREAFLRSLDVFCLPSRLDGLPFTLLEAMMTGLPCVASDVGDVARALGGTGVVVPPGDPAALGDALAGLAGSVDRRRELGSGALGRDVERYYLE